MLICKTNEFVADGLILTFLKDFFTSVNKFGSLGNDKQTKLLENDEIFNIPSITSHIQTWIRTVGPSLFLLTEFINFVF